MKKRDCQVRFMKARFQRGPWSPATESNIAVLFVNNRHGVYVPSETMLLGNGDENDRVIKNMATRYVQRGASLRSAVHAASLLGHSGDERARKSLTRNRLSEYMFRRQKKTLSLPDIKRASIYGFGRLLSGKLEYPSGRKTIFLLDTEEDWYSSEHPLWRAVDDVRLGAKLTLVNRIGVVFLYCGNYTGSDARWVTDYGDGITQTFYGLNGAVFRRMASAFPPVFARE